MIKKVSANQRGFRTVQFGPGVNLILADRSASAGAKDTTNAVGKSTLIEIIDFCLGANAPPTASLRVEALTDWSFTIELNLAGRDVSITRATAASG